MNPSQKNLTPAKWAHILSGFGLVISFFLPWAAWKDAVISGYYLPAGKFFAISGSRFGLSNPFPQLDFTFYIFWLIPALALAAIFLSLQNKRNGWPAFIAGALNLSLVTVFYLFTKTLTDLGVGSHVFSMLKMPFYLSAFFSLLFICTASSPARTLKKAGWVIAGPVLAFLGFMIIQKTVWNQTYSDTGDLKADYTVTAENLLREFAANDSAANHKYREKIIVVNGTASKVEQSADSTITIQFADSTGSYIVFSFDKEKYAGVKEVKAGDPVSAKGSCSGSIHSEILGTTSISFKRSTLNNK